MSMTSTFITSPKFYFTSESVTEGHPDKICDQVSDAVLDAIIAEDPNARVACECAVTTGLVLVMGEITTSTYVDFNSLVRDVVLDIGYTRAKFGFDGETCGVLALMDPGPERAKQEMYNIDPYPIVWIRALGQGRVYFTALGHREDLWEGERFQQAFVDAVHWLMSTGDPQAEPNYRQVVPNAAPKQESGG